MARAAEETMVAMDGRRLIARAPMTRHGGLAGKRAWLLRGYGLCWTDPRARQASRMTGRVHPEYLMVHTRREARAILLEGLDRVVGLFGDGYAAWAWLTTELASLDGAMPLTLLASGEIDRVAQAAEGDRQGDFA